MVQEEERLNTRAQESNARWRQRKRDAKKNGDRRQWIYLVVVEYGYNFILNNVYVKMFVKYNDSVYTFMEKYMGEA